MKVGIQKTNSFIASGYFLNDFKCIFNLGKNRKIYAAALKSGNNIIPVQLCIKPSDINIGKVKNSFAKIYGRYCSYKKKNGKLGFYLFVSKIEDIHLVFNSKTIEHNSLTFSGTIHYVIPMGKIHFYMISSKRLIVSRGEKKVLNIIDYLPMISQKYYEKGLRVCPCGYIVTNPKSMPFLSLRDFGFCLM